MANTVKPSTRLLPMDDIAQELQDVYSFTTSDANAPDTDKVFGVNSELIAVAATDPATGLLVSDRETIKNALNLGDLPASEYFTKSDGTKVQEFGDNVANVLSNEIRQLRDEFYQVRGELVRQGVIEGYNLYSGFQDMFKATDVKYESDYICGIAQDYMFPGVSTILPEAPSEFEVGDYFVIVQTADPLDSTVNPLTSIAKISAKDPVSGAITFAPSVTDLHKNDTKLYKSLGQYIKGTFSFSSIENSVVVNNEKYTMLNDDKYYVDMPITAKNSGYAVEMFVPDTAEGALTKFSIKANSIGSPGALQCYVIDRQNGDSIIGVSEIVSSLSAQTAQPAVIDFKFNQSVSTGEYPFLVSKQSYAFVVIALDGTDASNRWQVRFCTNASGTDLQTNDTNYEFYNSDKLNQDFDTSVLVNSDTMKKCDMYFILTTKQVVDEMEVPYREGLYSSKVSLPMPIEVSRARLTMRINKEGLFEVLSNSGTYPEETIMYVKKSGGAYDFSQETGIDVNEPVAIGTSIRSFENISSTQMTLGADQGIYLNQGDEVYRIGYTVQLKAKRKIWDPVTNAFVESNKETVTLPLVAIMPDGYHNTNFASDRIIFEQNLNDQGNTTTQYFTDFELQVKWNSNFSLDTLTKFSDELIGRILSLTLSFDKSL